MSWGRALWAIITVAVLYLLVAGVVVLLAAVGQMPWTAATEAVKTLSTLSSLAVGGVGPSVPTEEDERRLRALGYLE